MKSTQSIQSRDNGLSDSSSEPTSKFTALLTQPTVLVSLLLGFSSGLPLALSGSALQTWFAADSSATLLTIGFLSFVGMPYTLKFLWAPFVDRFVPPFLGRRRGWILVCQSALAVVIASMALFSPTSEPTVLMILAFAVAFLSATSDIAIDAYKIDVLPLKVRALGAAMGVDGYRIAMLVAGGLTLVIADHWSWKAAYLAMAALMSVGIITSIFGPEPEIQVAPPKTFKDSVVLPFVDYFTRRRAVWILVFIICYKLGDAFAGNLMSTFLIRAIQMTKTEIGTLVKFSGFFGTILGTIIGGLYIPRLGWYRALIIFGVAQAISNLIYLPMIWVGPNYALAGSAIFLDNFFGGMGTAAYVGFIMGLCNPRFTAFQYALLCALSAFGRTYIGPVAGYIAETFGWEVYFTSSLLFAAPGLLLIWWLKDSMEKMSKDMAEQRANLVAAPAT